MRALNQLSVLQVPAMANKSLYIVDHFYLGTGSCDIKEPKGEARDKQ